MSNNKKIRLALVDDHQIIIDGLVSLIKDHHSIDVACTSNSGEEMLQLLTTNNIDVLLTDVVMDEMNGRVLAKKVKQITNYLRHRLQFLILSALTSHEPQE